MAGPTLITGATGLIGVWVRRSWTAEDGSLVEVDHRTHDLLEPGVPSDIVRRIRPARVLHLAWTASGTPGYRTATDHAAWVRATMELVAATDEIGARTWVTGTAVDTDPEATDPYTTAKRELRTALSESVDAGRLGWLRPFYVFDPGAGRPALVADAATALESGVPVVLRAPAASHDFVHAADVGSAVVTAVRHHLQGIVEIGSGTLHSPADVVEALGAAWAPWEGGEQAGGVVAHHGLVAESQELRAAGWRPRSTEEFFAA
jgi:nucleoside-diphosphate-sugar epimerase